MTKTITTIYIDSDLKELAQLKHINLSRVCESALRSELEIVDISATDTDKRITKLINKNRTLRRINNELLIQKPPISIPIPDTKKTQNIQNHTFTKKNSEKTDREVVEYRKYLYRMEKADTIAAIMKEKEERERSKEKEDI